MNYSLLRKVRIVISLVFLLSIVIIFLDITNLLHTKVFNYTTYLQFVPSIIKFSILLIPAAGGFIIVLLMVLLFGRVYCSSVCPLGTIQDISSYLSKRFNKKKKYGYIKEIPWLRYSILIITGVSFLFGNLFLLNLLDPYSNTGRILTQLFNPLLTVINNFTAFTLEKFNIYILYPVEIKAFYSGLALFPFIFLMIVIYLSFKRGRLYCNTICPVGALLGLLSKVSLFKLKIDEKSCEGCGICARICKSECIDKKNKFIDFSRCVSCYNCLDICPSDSISYKLKSPFHQLRKKNINDSRRAFLSRVFLTAATLSSGALAQLKIIPKKESKIPINNKVIVTPPGSIGLAHFTGACTACHLCISACPTKVLQPSILEYGLFGILQPYMEYKTSFCNYECIICGEVCPTGAILPLIVDKKKIVQLGKAIFVKDNCIVETEKTACGACSEHCPTKAVNMVEYKDGLKIPEVTDKFCIGCGACEFACPTKPYKAIYVEGNLIHQVAEIRPVEKIEEKIDLKEKFPF